MYKVLLVDDERIVKLAIKSMIKWHESGLELIGTASNGISALQIVEKASPDIIITDIKMPGMDGVELIKKLKEKGFDGEILVLSNYNDFELVREAMRYGAHDYVLKVTVKTEDFSKLLNEVITKLENKKGISRNYTTKEVSCDAIRANLLSQALISEKVDFTAEVCELTKLYRIIKNEIIYTFVIKAIPKRNEQASTRILEVVQSIAGELLAKSRWYSVIEMDRNSTLLIALYNQSDVNIFSKDMAERLSEFIKTYYNIETGLVYSDNILEYSQFFSMARECIKCSELFFYSEYTGKVLSIGIGVVENEQSLSSIFRDTSDRIYDKVLKFELDSILNDFKHIVKIASYNQINPYRLKKYIKKILREVERKLIYKGYCSKELFDEYKNDEDTIYVADTEERLLDNIASIISDALESLSAERMNYRKEVREALEYIEKHACERIPLADISKHVNLNETYLCKVFKDDTGKSIVNYINEVKMKIAYRLLNKGDIMIKEAAAAVGIDDQFYFNRLFKKFYGVTPKDVKNRVDSKDYGL